ncbi:hypothetical protein SFK227_4271 [Shigella flexneri K-227]|uniref:Uncharacterized protein n=1 Tax=Shigella flexneri K-227 TaxID=766147 RepID=F5P1B4_SHIFL|nr:hypothetical protein ECOK1357_4258 [Escherichia coli OK1357]EGJ82986.1 hypothetical protein SF274771_4260 [Shigella flexneri 2747-71]EGK18198.1 hypothetical protein SFK218_4623 [Shigella flexneri K-218]EGK33332.1 hypothetical protein SFK227_4271 [Shigella flexneri K-227]EGW85251.1 hypothetical protein ECSTECDG1313_5081 [Escherichia coli STEC_DG131-3]EHU86813.1 hypothetical protein ECDEC4A_4867 [Escherichia coli DEC4A]EHV33238.1 hypothetical protein ECDEC5D_4980 [Escherichia coli DEC5D]EIQ
MNHQEYSLPPLRQSLFFLGLRNLTLLERRINDAGSPTRATVMARNQALLA